MSALTVFTYTEHEIRTLVIDDDVWFVVADVCGVLEIGNARQAAAQLDDDEVKQEPVTTSDGSGRVLPTNIMSEAGLYSLILRSRKAEAKAFKRWITHDVLPTIRKTGSYGSPAGMSFEEMTAHVIGELNARIDAAQSHARELEAPAAAWNDLAAAEGDVTVSDAAKILGRSGTCPGPRQLYEWLQINGWIFRQGGYWKAMQTAVNAGLLVERVSDYRHPSGERRLAAPQIRVTPKGLERLCDLFARERALAVIDGGLS